MKTILALLLYVFAAFSVISLANGVLCLWPLWGAVGLMGGIVVAWLCADQLGRR